MKLWRRRALGPFGEPLPAPPPAPDARDDAAPVSEEAEPLAAADWAATPAGEVPPWRRADRERVDQLRQAAAAGDRASVAAQAREVRRLVDLHRDGIITDAELVAAARDVLSASTG